MFGREHSLNPKKWFKKPKTGKSPRLLKGLSTLGIVAGIVMLCSSVSLAASSIDDYVLDTTIEDIRTQNSTYSEAIDTQSRFVVGEKNSVELCNFAAKAYSEGWNYVYGGKGQYMTSDLVVNIVNSNLDVEGSPYSKDGYVQKTLAANSGGERATDCSGLIMDFMWWAGDASNPIKELCPSIGNYNANNMLNVAVEKGNITDIPEIPGLLVHYNGHVGVYIGGGKVIESRGVDYGVTVTELSERNWVYWSKSPWIDYQLNGIYTIGGREVYLDDGVDIGRDAWINKYVYGIYNPNQKPSELIKIDLSARFPDVGYVSGGTEYTEGVINPGSGNYVNEEEIIRDGGTESPEQPIDNNVVVGGDVIAELLPTLEYDSIKGYLYNGYWFDKVTYDSVGHMMLESSQHNLKVVGINGNIEMQGIPPVENVQPVATIVDDNPVTSDGYISNGDQEQEEQVNPEPTTNEEDVDVQVEINETDGQAMTPEVESEMDNVLPVEDLA